MQDTCHLFAGGFVIGWIFMYPECTVNNLFERNKQRSAELALGRSLRESWNLRANRVRIEQLSCTCHAVLQGRLYSLSLYGFKCMYVPVNGARDNGSSRHAFVFPETEFLMHD